MASKSSYKPVTHVIFDVDGTLFDTEDIYDSIIAEIGQMYGKEYTVDMKMKILGAPDNVSVRLLVELMQLPITFEECMAMLNEKLFQRLNNTQFLPGAERILRHFHEHNVPLAIATSASKETTIIKFQSYPEYRSFFSHMVMGLTDPEVKMGKPSPDIFLVCASRFPNNPPPEKCLVFEDSPNGVTGAIAAGMQCVMIPSDETKPELCSQATLVLKSLNDIRPELFGLPPFS